MTDGGAITRNCQGCSDALPLWPCRLKAHKGPSSGPNREMRPVSRALSFNGSCLVDRIRERDGENKLTALICHIEAPGDRKREPGSQILPNEVLCVGNGLAAPQNDGNDPISGLSLACGTGQAQPSSCASTRGAVARAVQLGASDAPSQGARPRARPLRRSHHRQRASRCPKAHHLLVLKALRGGHSIQDRD